MERASIRIERHASLSLFTLAFVLLLPTIVMFFSSDQKLSTYHRRNLSEPPQNRLLIEDPSAYFDEFKTWYRDRVGFSISAGRFYRRVSYSIFGDASVPNILRSEKGFVYLASHSPDSSLMSISNSCPSAETWREKADLSVLAWRQVRTYFEQSEIEASLLIFPSKKTLYPEFFPAQVPKNLKHRCAQMRSPESPVIVLADAFPTSIFDAFPALEPHKAGRHFYPPENFHSDGESAARATDAFLDFLGYRELEKLDVDGFQVKHATGDMFGVFGFRRNIILSEPVSLNKGDIPRDPAFRTSLHADLGVPVYAGRYRNEAALTDMKVLLIANSFGARIAPYFSKFFRRVDIIETNRLRSDEQHADLLDGYAMDPAYDHVVFVLHDESIFEGRLSRYATAIGHMNTPGASLLE